MFFQAEDGIRDVERSRGLGDVYKRQEQTAYIKGRYIGTNARLILDIFEYCENNNEEGLLLFLDLKKKHFTQLSRTFCFKL